MVVCLFFILASLGVNGQNEPVYDELSVFFQVQNMGAKEIPAVIRDQEVLLPVSDVFDFLQIKNTLSSGMDTVSGFFLSQDAEYRIDRSKYQVFFQGKTYQLKNTDLVRTETNLYLLSKYFGEIFGLDCKFNIRTLSVSLTTKLEMPAVREMRLEQMRQNINRLKGDVKVDTTIQRNRPAFHFGMADWSAISTQQIGHSTDTRLNLALGAVIAGGEANAYLNYATNEPFKEKQQYYYWRFVNNDRVFLRQTTLGKITTDATSSIYNPVVGIKLTNSPTTYRRSFGSYPLSDYTNPGWMVELYVNNVLVDYKKADASGFFTFEVPLVYGSSKVKLKFYGPWGEERAKEQSISIPFSFLPPGEFEYSLRGGMVEDDKQTIFSRGEMHYGLTNTITMGAGVEYLSSVLSGTTMPFVTLASRPIPNMLLMGEFMYGVRGKGILSLQLPHNIQAELNYTKYQPGQKALINNYLEERKLIFTLPFKLKKISFFNRTTYDQIILPGTGYSTAEWLISAAGKGFSSNLTNYAMFSKSNSPYIYSTLAFSFRLPSGIMFIPQTQYEYSQHEFISFRAGLEKYLFKNGYLSLSYENNFKNRVQSAQFGFRYDLPFAQTGFTATQSNDQTTLMEMARGSLIVDKKTNYVGANNRISVGKGGIVFAPFLDLNCNNKRDKGEPKAFGLNIRINGGTATKNDKDTTVLVLDLEPYTKYLVELDASSFDNVAWKIHNAVLSIVVDPNSLKLVEIPVSVVGEVSGMVMKEKSGTKEGLGRIIVNIYNQNSILAARTMSEQDGYYSYLGLKAGTYNLKIDSAQMKKLSMVATPTSKTAVIKPSIEGDVVDGLDFVLKSTEKEPADTTKKAVPVPQPEKISDQDLSAYLQIAAFIGENNAQRFVNTISAMINTPVKIRFENGWYKVLVDGFTSKEDMERCKRLIVSKNIVPEKSIMEIIRYLSAENKNIAERTKKRIAQGVDLRPENSTIINPGKPTATVPAPVTQPAGKPAIPPSTSTTSRPVTTQPQDLQPVTGKELISMRKYYFVEIGTFKTVTNAAKLVEKVANLIPYPIEITFRDKLYKVRFGGFDTQAEANACVRMIMQKRLNEKARIIINYEEIGSNSPAELSKISDECFIQVGAFNFKENAANYYKYMSGKYHYPIVLMEEAGFYKVRFGPFKSAQETQKYREMLLKQGVDCFNRCSTVKFF